MEEDWSLLVKRIVRVVLRSWPTSGMEAEDLEQEGMLAVCLAVRSFDPLNEKGSSLRTWVGNNVKWHLLNLLRKSVILPKTKRFRPTVQLIGNMDDPQVVVEYLNLSREPKSLSVERDDSEVDNRDTVEHLLTEVNAKKQSFLRMKFLEGLEYVEVAKRLGCSVNRCHQIIVECRKTLEGQL